MLPYGLIMSFTGGMLCGNLSQGEMYKRIVGIILGATTLLGASSYNDNYSSLSLVSGLMSSSSLIMGVEIYIVFIRNIINIFTST